MKLVPGLQTLGPEAELAYIIIEGPGMAIYTDYGMYLEAKDGAYNRGERDYPFRGGRFYSLEDAKNWVQVSFFLRMK